ncbi:hypothetical protein GCM10022419_087300 [Nonomuraea rosea]|uniref:Uncharacterized protein n=1 Tax=Nonomuraea rosea TaxID=638574 RepID=A0ABP6YV88_9ACTN
MPLSASRESQSRAWVCTAWVVVADWAIAGGVRASRGAVAAATAAVRAIALFVLLMFLLGK